MAKVKLLAEAKGINKYQLSLKSQLSDKAVLNVWDGVSDGTKAGTLRKIAAALDCEAWHLFEGAPYPEWYTPPKP